MRHTSLRSLLAGVSLVAIALAPAACASRAASAEPTDAGGAAVVQLAPENTVSAVVATISSGPVVSGQLTPAREATIRAQVGGSIVALTVDRGQAVDAGQLIARISSRDLDAAMESAQSAIKSAETTLSVARSEAQRTAALVKGGALAARDLEQSANAVTLAESQVSAAKARQKSIWQQIDDTTVKAPFAGIVSERAANLGDVVSNGTPLLTIIDPSSMRLEALVPSERIQQVKPGSKVTFRVRGFADQTFAGRIDRLSPTADAITRQVSIFVSLPNTGGKLIAGLFAEGRVETTSRQGVVVPLSAVDETGAAPSVTRIRNGQAERIVVELGPRQTETEQVEIVKGIAAGDVLIVGSAKGIAPGTPVRVVQ